MIKTRDEKMLDENTLVLNVLSHAVDQRQAVGNSTSKAKKETSSFRIIPTILYVRTRLRRIKGKKLSQVLAMVAQCCDRGDDDTRMVRHRPIPRGRCDAGSEPNHRP